MTYLQFKKTVYMYYRTDGRSALPWRKTRNPYYILVSEIMLQQTQVARVIPKYKEFIAVFPKIEVLAQASLCRVMQVWQGLGYNRRALLLQRLAQEVVKRYQGKIPHDPEILKTLPGIGKATAGSFCAFAFNKPVPFIETNIRSVFIHHFFHDAKNVRDDQLIPYIEKTIDRENPRQWYWALMDYGVYLKETLENPSRRSIHYVHQSRFQGSDRQIRGAILKLLTQQTKISSLEVYKKISGNKERIEKIIKKLIKEKLVGGEGKYLFIPR